MWACIQEHIFSERKARIVQIKMKLSVRDTAQNGQQHGKSCEAFSLKSYFEKHTNISSIDSVAVLSVSGTSECIILTNVKRLTWSTFRSSGISPAEKHHKCSTRGPVRSVSARGAVCCLLARCILSFARRPKTRDDKAENGLYLLPEKSI